MLHWRRSIEPHMFFHLLTLSSHVAPSCDSKPKLRQFGYGHATSGVFQVTRFLVQDFGLRLLSPYSILRQSYWGQWLDRSPLQTSQAPHCARRGGSTHGAHPLATRAATGNMAFVPKCPEMVDAPKAPKAISTGKMMKNT